MCNCPMKSLDTTPRRVRFGIATDEPLSGTGLHEVLKGEDRFRVIWLPAAMERLVHALKLLSVDVLLMDMACGFSDDVVRELREAGLEAPLILWMREQGGGPLVDERCVVLDKRASPEMFLACVESVAAGGAQAGAQLDGAHGVPQESAHSAVHISPREAELMDLVSEGLSNRQIGERLGLTEGSVKVYFSRLFRKLGVSDRVGLALYSVRQPWDALVVRGGSRGGAARRSAGPPSTSED